MRDPRGFFFFSMAFVVSTSFCELECIKELIFLCANSIISVYCTFPWLSKCVHNERTYTSPVYDVYGSVSW